MAHSRANSGRDFAESCRDVAQQIDEALAKPPAGLGAEVDEVERELVRMRDVLIDQLRATGSGGDTENLQSSLDSINTALSLIVGVEYPSGGVHRQLLAQARDLLRGMGRRPS